MNISEKLSQQISILPLEKQEELLSLVRDIERARLLSTARTGFLPFVKYMWPDFVEGSHHRIIASLFDDVIEGRKKRIIINMPPRHQLSVDTPILTTDGWKTMQTIRRGDHVFSPSGKPVLVTGKSPVTNKRIYEVETTDGHVIECDDDHLWTYSAKCKGKGRYWKTASTKEILGREYRHGPYLPDYGAIELPDANLPIDPYVLGVWLGDGTKYGASIGCSSKDEQEMRGLIEECGYRTSERDGYQMFGILGLHVKLRECGLLENKHIPEAYMLASVEQRISLIQGLMDTDGSVGKNGRCTFHQTDRKMAEDFCSLVNSLGIKARITQRQTHFGGYDVKPSYRVNFKFGRAARLSRKASRLSGDGVLNGRSIRIRETDRFGDVQCLQIQNEDGLFLAGRNFVVTHNTKSEFASVFLPAYFLGRNPNKKIIETSHTAELAVGFGRKVRNIINSEDFHTLFPGVSLSQDSKAAGRWSTNRQGEYFAIGVGGAIAGKGADLFVIDDPHSEQDAIIGESNPEVYQRVMEWYEGGPRQRLQPGAAIIIVMTRWSLRDLTGQLIKKQLNEPGSDTWEIIELPAILPEEPGEGEHYKPERPIWPEFWKIEELRKTRASIPVSKWNAQYQQNPTSEEGALIKREYWRDWDSSSLPKIEALIMSWDTAFTTGTRSDYSACTVWGIFTNEEDQTNNVILVDAIRGKWEFPELKRTCLELYDEHKPDICLIEARAAGHPLIFEMRKMGIPVQDITVGRGNQKGGNDKIARVNAVTDIFASRMVWARKSVMSHQEVIEECAAFPAGEHDDYVDTVTMALTRFRQGGWVGTDHDYEDDDEYEQTSFEYY